MYNGKDIIHYLGTSCMYMFDNIIHEPFAFSDYLLSDFVIAMSNVIDSSMILHLCRVCFMFNKTS